MKTIGLCALAAVLCIPHFATAQDKTSRTIGGTLTTVTEWTAIKPRELVINIVDLPNAEVSRAEYRKRNNGLTVQQRAWFDGRKGFVYLEHLFSYIYNENATFHFQDPETTKKLTARYCQRAKKTCEIVDTRKVHAYGERSGWVRLIRIRETGRRCIGARVAFLSADKFHTLPEERYDTGITYRDCSGKRTLDDVVQWLEGAKIVEPSYNRVR